MSDVKEEVEQLDLPLLIEYGVLPEEKEQALAVYERFRRSPVAVTLLRCYYSDLPEAREEMIIDLKSVASKQDSALVVLQSTNHDYLYIYASGQGLFLGEFKNGIEDEGILHHFGFRSKDDFCRKTAARPADMPSVATDVTEPPAACVACGVGPGEPHILGCPVEQCPWCRAQLSRCNCRFDKLGVSAIEDEEQLDHFEELLERKGRIPFKAGHNPSYPAAGNDPLPFFDQPDK